MEIPFVLLQTILVPAVAAPLVALMGKRIGKYVGWIASAILIYTTSLLLIAGSTIWTTALPISETYTWSAVSFTLEFGFIADNLSLPVALIMNLICTAASIYSIHYMKHRIDELYGEENKSMHGLYHALYLLFPIGLVGVALSSNLIAMYLFIELVLIPSYFLLDFFGYRERHRVATMYFIWNQVAAGLFLIGAILASTATGGSFSINALSTISGQPIAFWVCLLILVGWLIKMAAFGLHVWLPYAHGEHLAHIAAIIATIAGLGSYVIVRLLAVPLAADFQVFGLPIMVLGLITMVYGGLLTLAQDDVKRLYACSTISQTAYSLVGIGSLTAMGLAGGVFYFVSHILGKSILLCIAGVLMMQTGSRDMNKMGGLAKKMPFTAALAILGSMILSAIPPLSGLQAEWVMFVGIFQGGTLQGALQFAIPVIAIFATFLTAAYTFWPVKRIFFGPLSSELEDVKEAPKSMTLPLFILALVSLLFGIYPDVVMHFLSAFF
ncbi:NADH dehydrogenase [Candidatus Thorarchaeota archaeon]|nr:MAG: NADH dehydrogenase [Candidatus Thorarchaeota archaeon]